MVGREKFKKNLKLIHYATIVVKLFPKTIKVFLWDLSSSHSQLLFIGLRYILLKSLIKSCGNNVRIGTNVQIVNWDGLVIGDNVSIHSNCYLDAAGSIEIGNDVSIAHNSSILSTNHDWLDLSIPIKYNTVTFGKVKIANDVWIGCGCRILSGVDIGYRSIVAAGAIVNKNVNSRVIVGGVPAKIIKEI